MRYYFKRALQDMLENGFLHAVAIITIALSVLIVSAFTVFIINANDIMSGWKKGIRIMAYLEADVPDARIVALKQNILGLPGVDNAVFISKDEALRLLKQQMKRQSSVLENLRENQLPDAFEIRMAATADSWEKVEELAAKIETLPDVDDVEYGQRWLGRFTTVFNLFRVAWLGMGSLFLVAAVFIVANTIRLVLYSRQEEVEIMRLVGATDGFIKAPIYIEGLFQGAIGGLIGMVVLYTSFLAMLANMDQGFAAGSFEVRFLSFKAVLGVILCSTFVGWLGCFVSLRQFLKE